jgi:hypothetical protein
MLDMNYCDSNAIPTTHLSLREINQQNQKFCEEQNALRAVRMSNSAILQVAFREVKSEATLCSSSSSSMFGEDPL